MTFTTGVILTAVIRRQVVFSSTRAAETSASSLVTSFQEKERELERTTKLLADRPGTRSLFATDDATIADHMNELKALTKLQWVAWLDPEGNIRGISDKSPKFGKTNFAGTDLAKQLSAGKTSWANLEFQSTPYLVSGSPIRIGDYVKGSIIAGHAIDSDYLAHLSHQKGDEIVLLKGDEVVATSSPVKIGHRDQSGIFEAVGEDGEKLVGQATKLSGTNNFQILTLIPLATVTDPLRPFTYVLYALITLGVGALALVSWYFQRSLLNPISRLVAYAGELGGGLWPAPLQTTRKDEIGVLENTLDQMTADLQHKQQRLEAMLDIDPLTELLNHRKFREKLSKVLSDGADTDLVLLDIDSFEAFNRDYGSTAGDGILKKISDLVKEQVGETEGARYAGNEFIFLAPHGEGDQLGERLRREIETKLPVTVSVGVTSSSPELQKLETLLLSVEIAVGQAKTAGKNRMRRFSTFYAAKDSLDGFLQHGNLVAVRALAEAVDAKDEYTRGHSQRVAEYARELAQYCGFEPGFTELVYLAGQLHDVGKIGVPDSALKKPGKLTDEEFDMIKQHPALGEKIVGQIPELQETLVGIRGHHERFDGRGYPDQLVGDDIPLLARVLAIADTFDAMTSDRPYRKGLELSTALDEIEKGCGTQFDPVLAERFVELWRTKEKLQSLSA